MKLIFISLDTLCSNHVGCYGWQFDTTPSIDKWSKKAVLFERSYATDVPTPPSYTAMFSGRYGVHNGIFGFQAPDSYIPGPPMLQQHFNWNDHKNCAISNLYYPCPWFFPGWQEIIPPGVRFQGGRAPEVTDTAIDWLKRNGTDDFFLFVHYWTPHQPYNKAPEEHRKLFPTEQYKDIESDLSIMKDNKIMNDFHSIYHERGEGDANMTSGEVLARYDSQIHFVDEAVGRLFDYLDEAGLADDTAVVLTSDHGEAFGEYGSFDHFTCYENISHVPLLIRAPGFPEGKRVKGLVCGADLYPTILEMAGIDVPEGIDGKSLIDCAKGDADTPHEFLVTDVNALCAQRMLIQDNWGLVHTLNRGPYKHVKEWELFDLSGDPEKELSAEKPELVREMKEKMEAWVSEMSDGHPDLLAIKADEGGWTFNHGSFTKAVLQNLDEAKADPNIWKYFCKKNGHRWPGLVKEMKELKG